MSMKPSLNEVVIPDDINRKFPECCEAMAPEGLRTVTMSQGQWDHLLQAAYDEGWLLLELDEDEKLIHIYRRPLN
jgi:hypothetical protein